MTLEEALALVDEGRAVTSASLPNGAVVKELDGIYVVYFPLTKANSGFFPTDKDIAATWHEVEGWL